MNTETLQALTDWLHGRHYDLEVTADRLILKRGGHQLAVIIPPDTYQVSSLKMNFAKWVEFNKCLRNIRHYLMASGQAK